MRAFRQSPDAPVPAASNSTLEKVLRNPFFRLFFFVLLSGIIAMLLALVSSSLPEASQQVLVPLGSTVISYWVTAWVCEERPIPWELAPVRAYQLFYGLGVGAVLMLLCVGFVALLGTVSISRAEQVDWPEWWSLLASSVVLAGIAEEILTRGVLFRFFEELSGTWVAIALSGIVFGALHLPNPNATVWSAFSIALTAGVFLGLIYALTRSLWWAIGVHAAWNAMQGIILGIPVSGITVPGLFATELAGPESITGGTFGIEASIVTVVVYSCASVYLGYLVHRRGMAVLPSWYKPKNQNPEVPVAPALAEA